MKFTFAFATTMVAAMSLAALETEVTGGVNPAVSPDGRRVAFQRHEGGVLKLGVCNVADGGDLMWVEEGPGMAAFPVWTPSGELLYTWGHDTSTALEALTNKVATAYGLRLWSKGERHDLTSGRCRDYMPSVSPDGKTAWFCTTRWTVDDDRAYEHTMYSQVATLDLTRKGAKPVRAMDSPCGDDSGFGQPVVSPDGRALVWAQLDNYLRDNWHLMCAKVARIGERDWARLTPVGMSAHSPSWHPDGRLLAFTGFRKDDPGWGVWVMDVKTGAMRRLIDGENARFSPDGTFLVYNRGHKVYRRGFFPGDRPDGAAEKSPYEAGRTFWKTADAPNGKVFKPTDDFVLGWKKTFHVRARVKWNGDVKGVQHFVIGDYEEHHFGFDLYAAEGKFYFALRDPDGMQSYAGIDVPPAGEHEFFGVRTPNGMWVAFDGRLPAFCGFRSGRPAPLDHPRKIMVGAEGLTAGTEVLSAAVGFGWAEGMRHPTTREDVFGKAPPMARPFEVVALVDSLDFALKYDIECDRGNVEVLEHVLKSGANVIWWRDKGGGKMRYPSREQEWPLTEAPFSKLRLPQEDAYGYLRLEAPRANAFPLIAAECDRRGLKFGIHTTLEENHWLSAYCANWNLAHPECWGCTQDGRPWSGSCSLAYPEVMRHKLAMVDERLEYRPGTIFLDLWRNGGWSPAHEYVKPVLDRWRAKHGDEPPPEDAKDPRWLRIVSRSITDYLTAFSEKCHARGCRFAIGAYGFGDGADARIRDKYAINWARLAKEGVVDDVVAMGVEFDRADPWASTERIYRNVVSRAGKARVYFQVSTYDFERRGISEYMRLTKLSAGEVSRRLTELARKAGAAGVVLECVDYGNYTPEIAEGIRAGAK